MGKHRVSRKSPKNSCHWVVRVFRKRTRKGSSGGPGRAGPALTGFFVEPFPLDFWKLEKSFVRSASDPLLVYPGCVKSFIKNIRNLNPRTLSPKYRYTCFTFIALFIVPLPTLSDSIANDAKRCSLARRDGTLNGGFVIVALVQRAKRRHSRSESPELLGRTIFFIVAVGRSPPRLATAVRGGLF
jgi:hypothetical protein